MSNLKIIFIISLIIFIILLFFIFCKNSKSPKNTERSNIEGSNVEGYGQVLGSLAPYRSLINECINECNREDPDRRLQESGNWNCGVYCESAFSEFARKGIPPENLGFENTQTLCERQCSDATDHTLTGNASIDHNSKRKCISVCSGQNEVAEWCKEMWCPYQDDESNEVCMKGCMLNFNTNNNQNSWNWIAHG